MNRQGRRLLLITSSPDCKRNWGSTEGFLRCLTDPNHTVFPLDLLIMDLGLISRDLFC